MSKTILAVLALIVGLFIGAIGALSLGGGAMMGAGVATGVSAGACSTVQAAQDLGLMTAEDVDRVLIQATTSLAGEAALPEDQELAGSAAECAEVLARLRQEGS